MQLNKLYPTTKTLNSTDMIKRYHIVDASMMKFSEKYKLNIH